MREPCSQDGEAKNERDCQSHNQWHDDGERSGSHQKDGSESLMKEAGASPGVYTNLFATKEQVQRIIADPRIKAVALTGSEAAGAIVASQAGKYLKKSTMELGGSDAFVVLEDADLDRAVSWAVWGRMNNTGQCCIAAKRFIVVDEVADEFIRRFKASFESEALHACDLLLKHDARLGRIPKSRQTRPVRPRRS
jgi:acyl-CoA reductase-like NAD-dependent aldehyde dehydrogenase